MTLVCNLKLKRKYYRYEQSISFTSPRVKYKPTLEYAVKFQL